MPTLALSYNNSYFCASSNVGLWVGKCLHLALMWLEKKRPWCMPILTAVQTQCVFSQKSEPILNIFVCKHVCQFCPISSTWTRASIHGPSCTQYYDENTDNSFWSFFFQKLMITRCRVAFTSGRSSLNEVLLKFYNKNAEFTQNYKM